MLNNAIGTSQTTPGEFKYKAGTWFTWDHNGDGQADWRDWLKTVESIFLTCARKCWLSGVICRALVPASALTSSVLLLSCLPFLLFSSLIWPVIHSLSCPGCSKIPGCSEKGKEPKVMHNLVFYFLGFCERQNDFSRFSGKNPVTKVTSHVLLGVWKEWCVVLAHLLCCPCSGLPGPQHPDLLHGSLQNRWVTCYSTKHTD